MTTSTSTADEPARSTHARFEITGLERGHHDGALIVIDVIRAFTTGAAAFAAGAHRIVCVESIDAALELRRGDDRVVLMGEERGVRPDGFDFGNSPAQFDDVDLAGATVVQRTSNGTRGLAWITAPHIVAAAAVNASATARHVAGEASVRLVCTGATCEDRACAEHLARLLTGSTASPVELRDRIVAAGEEHFAAWTRPRSSEEARSFEADLARCADVDRYDFAMVGARHGDSVVLHRVDVPAAGGDEQ